MANKLLGSVGLSPGSDSGFDLDTKGQIHGYTSTQYALDVGANNFVIYADSSTASGLAYGASAKSILSASGDILYASGANTLARLAKGDNDEVLTLKSGIPSWESAGGGAWTALGSATEASATSEISLDVADHDLYMLYYNVSTDASVESTYMSATINDVTANYRSIYANSSGTAFATGTNTGATMWRIDAGDLWNESSTNSYGYIFLNKVLSTSMEDFIGIRSTCANTSSSGANWMSLSSGTSEETSISSIQLKFSASNIQGSFTVNAMDF